MRAAAGLRYGAEDHGRVLQTVIAEAGPRDRCRGAAFPRLAERKIDEPAGCEIGRERDVEQAALPRRIHRRHARQRSRHIAFTRDDPNPARALGHQHPSVGKERESSTDRRDRSRPLQPQWDRTASGPFADFRRRTRLARENGATRQACQRDCSAMSPPLRLHLCVLTIMIETNPGMRRENICCDRSVSTSGRIVKFASPPPPMVVGGAMTKTASGSGVWKRRGRVMLTYEDFCCPCCRRADDRPGRCRASRPLRRRRRTRPLRVKRRCPPAPRHPIREAQGVGRPLLYWGAGRGRHHRGRHPDSAGRRQTRPPQRTTGN